MLLHDLRRRFAERLRVHWAIQRLEALDDHLLADMGIARESITDRVRGRR